MTREPRPPSAFRRMARQVWSTTADEPVPWWRGCQFVSLFATLMLTWVLLLRLIGLGSLGADFWRDLGIAPVVAAAVAMVNWTRGRVRHRLPAAIGGFSTLLAVDVASQALIGRDGFRVGWVAMALGTALISCYLFTAITHLPRRAAGNATGTAGRS